MQCDAFWCIRWRILQLQITAAHYDIPQLQITATHRNNEMQLLQL